MVLFLRNKRFNFMLFGGDYYLRNSGLPPSLETFNIQSVQFVNKEKKTVQSIQSVALTQYQNFIINPI